MSHPDDRTRPTWVLYLVREGAQGYTAVTGRVSRLMRLAWLLTSSPFSPIVGLELVSPRGVTALRWPGVEPRGTLFEPQGGTAAEGGA